jgi:hypothetical protein
MLQTIKEALAVFGAVEPRKAEATNPLPFRGKGFHPNGSISLELYARFMHKGKPNGPVAYDTLTFEATEWAALLPARVEPGVEWAVPEAAARKFAPALGPADDSTTPTAESARVAKLRGVVLAVEHGRARARLSGEWETQRHQDGTSADKIVRATASAEGIMEIGADGKSLESLRLVFQGLYRAPAPYDKPRQMGAVVEWKR